MPRIYKLSRTGVKLLYKIRHHRGHGIHSPFVFNLVTKVIEEKSPYHAYQDIKDALEGKSYKYYRVNKYNLLAFRLVNYFESRNILEIGSGYGLNTLCLTAHSSKVNCTCVETSLSKYSLAQNLYEDWGRNIKLYTDLSLPDLEEKQDCIYIDLSNYNHMPEDFISYLVSLCTEKTFIIVKGIRTNKRNQALWKSIKDIKSRTAVLDLFNLGIVFFDTKLYRWKYQISF
ncbi:MAG: class I SAM-dependent methyltransferase [Dysgonomonas sp.]|nr:class I SAM-dependent methyltransferase [Dysgonomonas sp.]